MPETFKDHFSAQAKTYAEFRPTYPAKLFEYLASLCPGQQLCWDSATGSGQAAVGLAHHFERVIATDASQNQIANATIHPKITYRVMAAEKTDFADASFDLVTVAAALHWLDLDAFYREVRRTLKPAGIFAAWMYELLQCPELPELNALIQRYYLEIVGQYWPPERRHIETRYRDLALPYPEISSPDFEMTTNWTRGHLEGFLLSWSASQAYQKATGRDPLLEIRKELNEIWQDANSGRTIVWPLTVKVCRKESV